MKKAMKKIVALALSSMTASVRLCGECIGCLYWK